MIIIGDSFFIFFSFQLPSTGSFLATIIEKSRLNSSRKSLKIYKGINWFRFKANMQQVFQPVDKDP